MKTLSVAMTVLLAISSPSFGCGIFETCKPNKNQPVKPKPSAELEKLKERVALLEKQSQAYVITIAKMHQHMAQVDANVAAQFAELKRKN